MAIIQSGSSSSLLTIDTTSTAARTTLYDINGNPMSDVNSLGNTLNALNSTVTTTLGGQASYGVTVQSTSGSITVSFEATINNSNWFALSVTPVGGGSAVTSTSADGQWIGSISGFYAVRVRVSAISGGSSMVISTVASPGPSAGAAITISGTVTANQGTATTISGAWPVEVTDGTNILGTSAHPIKTDPTGTTTQPISGTVTANAGSGTFTIGGTVTANIGTTNGLALDTSVNGILVSQGSATSGEKGPLIQGAVTTSAPTYTTTQTSPLSLTTSGLLRVDGSGVTQPVSGTVTANAGTGSFIVVQATAANLNATVTGTVIANQGTANTLANAWSTKITDDTNGPVAVKTASTAAVATDPSLVVSLSPNSPLPNLATVDSGNSSTAALGAAGVFTGTSTSSLGFSTISILVMAIGGTAPPGILGVQQSSDGTNWDIQDNYSIIGGTASPTGEFDVSVNLKSSFYRVVYTNGATVQTAFRLQTIRIPIYSPTGDAPTQKGIQAATFLPVQEPKDTGRVVKIYEATATTGVTTEAMLTLTPLTGFVAGATGTSFTVTTGKTFRIQTFNLSVRGTANNASASGLVRLRISSTGAVTTGTAVSTTVSVLVDTLTTAIVGWTQSNSTEFPDGLELSGTQQFGISQLTANTSCTIDVQLIGYEY